MLLMCDMNGTCRFMLNINHNVLTSVSAHYHGLDKLITIKC